jgi:predicted nucleotidyltransferase component of viral defense system
MMDTCKLLPETRRLWERLRQEPLVKGFVLIGGTALTLRIGHRVSEDLDFAYLGLMLPKQRLRLLARYLQGHGIALVPNQDTAVQEEFINAGLDLDDSQQNYLARMTEGTVKVSFVRFENNLAKMLEGNEESALRVATLDEIFKTKVIACAERSKTRDWFDLYLLMTQHGYSGEDFHRAFVDGGNEYAFDIASMRLRSGTPSQTDEGYASLMDKAPSPEEMRNFFVGMLDQLEVDLSRSAFKSSRLKL